MKIFTNGCFDIIHAGHIEFLKKCSHMGSVIVGLNSDSSVKKLKGISRPIIPQDQRKKILESIRFVNKVIIFEEDTPLQLIKKIRPDLIIKGPEYSNKQIVGSDIAKTITISGPFDNLHSTDIINKIRNGLFPITGNIHNKVWGHEIWMVNHNKYCGKILHLNKNYTCSYHYHKIKDETFYLLCGLVQLTFEKETFIMAPGETIHISPEIKHSFMGLEDSTLIEISTQHFEEDNYRLTKSRKIEDVS